MKDKRQYEVIDSRQLDHLRVFHDVARALTGSLELEDILRTIMEKMAGFFGPERWSLLLVDRTETELNFEIAVGENSQSLRGLKVRMGEGVAGWVAATGNPLIVPDVSLDPKWSAYAKAHPELDIQSIACVPIRSGPEDDRRHSAAEQQTRPPERILDLVSAHSVRLRGHRDRERKVNDVDPGADDHG